MIFDFLYLTLQLSVSKHCRHSNKHCWLNSLQTA